MRRSSAVECRGAQPRRGLPQVTWSACTLFLRPPRPRRYSLGRMSSLSAHLLGSYSKSQSQSNIVYSNSGIYNSAMHGAAAPFGGSSSNTTLASNNTSFMSSFQDVSLSTAQQIGTLQAKLDKKLGPEYVSSRPGGNGTHLRHIWSTLKAHLMCAQG